MHYLGWRGKRNIKRGEQREEEKLGSVLGTNRVRIKKYRETAAAVAGGGSVLFSRTSPRVLSRQWLRRAWMAPPPCPCPPHFQHLLGSLLLLQVPLVLHLKCPWSQNSGHAPAQTLGPTRSCERVLADAMGKHWKRREKKEGLHWTPKAEIRAKQSVPVWSSSSWRHSGGMHNVYVIVT